MITFHSTYNIDSSCDGVLEEKGCVNIELITQLSNRGYSSQTKFHLGPHCRREFPPSTGCGARYSYLYVCE